jgi:hypothetical protein
MTYLRRLDRKFDLVIDRCCLHVLPATRYAEYVHAIASLLVPERNAPPQVFRRRSAGIIRAEPFLSQRYSETLRSRVRYPGAYADCLPGHDRSSATRVVLLRPKGGSVISPRNVLV